MLRIASAALCCFCFWIALMVLAVPAWAIDVGSDGSDGALNLTGSGTTTINLALATTGSWDTPGNGNGVYDPEKWAVVFKYTSVNIGSGRTVQFTNHPSGAPVVWLVQGNVSNSGTINVSGGNGQGNGTFSTPGPGGFRGGKSPGDGTPASAGLGPGGGGLNSSAGYATAGSGSAPGGTYGNARVLPLIGGSGGSGGTSAGGAGGGAILIAANGTVSVGVIVATAGGPIGSGYGGSGGGIRLVANSIQGAASGLSAYGSTGGGTGRIRIEANTFVLTGASNPAYTWMLPLNESDLAIWPPEGNPRIRVETVGGVPVPAEPQALFTPPGDLFLVSSDSVDVALVGTNVPVELARRWNVKLRMTRRTGAVSEVTAHYASGDSVSSQWTARLPYLPDMDFVALQARASRP